VPLVTASCKAYLKNVKKINNQYQLVLIGTL